MMGKREKERDMMEQLHARQLIEKDQELTYVRQECERIMLENERLKQEHAALTQRVAFLERQEASVLDAIVKARETAAQTIAAAQHTAQDICQSANDVVTSARDISASARSIIKQAEDQAAAILSNAHGEAASIAAKANERAVYVLSEARAMGEDQQSLVDNMRERMHRLLSESIANIRDFAAKFAVLYANGLPTDLEPLLRDSIRDIELHLRQTGAPPRADNAPALGYTDAQELLKALERLQGRTPDEDLDSDSDAALRDPDDSEDEHVWTVDEVMRKGLDGFEGARAAGFERLSDTAPRLPAMPLPPISPPRSESDAQADSALSGMADTPPAPPIPIAAAAPPIPIPATFAPPNMPDENMLGISAQDAIEGFRFMGQRAELSKPSDEGLFDGLNLRQGGHSKLEFSPGAGLDAGIMPQSELRSGRRRDAEVLPSDFHLG